MNSKKLAAEYRRRKRSAEARVVRWEWATQPDRSLEPLFFERHKFARGRRIKAPKRPQEGQIAYGLDAKGLVAVEREYVGGNRFYESFYEAREWVRYDYDKAPLAQNRLRHEDGRLLELVRDGKYGGFVEQYRWQDGHVVRIDREVTDRKHGWKDWFEITWDGDEVTEILGWDPLRQRTSIIFARPQESFAKLAAAVEERLVKLIPPALAACKLAEPVYSLVLAYYGENNDMLPPALAVGLASERSRLSWNPAEYHNHPILLGPDDKLSVLCRKLNQRIAMENKWEAGRKLLERVAARLREKSWKKILKRTNDFVVFAVDYELANLARALKQARPRAASRRRRSSTP